MTGILNMMLGAVGVSTNTFNIVAGVYGTSAGYADGSAGTAIPGTSAGSISGSSTFGGRTISEIDSGVGQSRLRVKGFTSNPGAGWLKSVTANSVTLTGATATYAYDTTNGSANFLWTTSFGFVNGNTYNGNTITHNP